MARKLNLDTSERLDIVCKRGDSFSMTVTLKDSAGDPLLLETNGYEFQMQVRTSNNEQQQAAPEKSPIVLKTPSVAVKEPPTSDQVTSSEGTFSVSKNDLGEVLIYATAEDMRKVSPGRYTYELQYSVGEINKTVKTVLKGSFTVKDDISE